MITNLMRESALEARDIIFSTEPDSPCAQLTRLSSVARAVWTQNTKLASILIKNSSLGLEHIFTDGASVHLLNPSSFEDALLKAKG